MITWSSLPQVSPIETTGGQLTREPVDHWLSQSTYRKRRTVFLGNPEATQTNSSDGGSSNRAHTAVSQPHRTSAELSNMCFTCLVEAWQLSDFIMKCFAFENRLQPGMALGLLPGKQGCSSCTLHPPEVCILKQCMHWRIRWMLPPAPGRLRQQHPEFTDSQHDILRTRFKRNKSSSL